MQPYVLVKFERMTRDLSVEASVHRWVVRLESAGTPIRSASIVIEQARRCTAVRLRLELVDGSASTLATSHGDIYVAVADTFRAARRQLLARTAAGGGARFGLSAA